MKILLDMDGVLCNFVDSAAKLHGKDASLVTHWGIDECWGLTEDEFWEPIHRQGRSFWYNLEKYPWTDELISLVESYAKDVYICTTPCRDPDSLKGKLEWIQDKLPPKYASRYIMTGHKQLMSKPDTLLIDDSDANIDKFLRGGKGEVITFPRPWNSFRDKADDPLTHIKSYLSLLLKEIGEPKVVL